MQKTKKKRTVKKSPPRAIVFFGIGVDLLVNKILALHTITFLMMEDAQLMQTELPLGGLANGMSMGISNGGGLISHRPHYHRFTPYPLHRPHLQTEYLQHPALMHRQQRHIGYVSPQQKQQLQTISLPPSSSPSSSSHIHSRIDSPVTMDVDEKDEHTGTHISQLYPEILVQIFEKLSVRDRGQAAQVCTTWRDAAYSKSVWKGVEARLHLRQKSNNLFTSLQRRGIKKVQVLSIRRTVKDVIIGISNLETLNLSGCYSITDANLCHAFNQDLPNLKVLNLSLCKQITDTSLNRIAYHLKNLEILELGGCTNLTNASLSAIAYELKKLQRLNLRSCWQINDQGISLLAGLNNVNTTTDTKLSLKHLGLQDCQRLTDEALKFLSQGLPTIETINLSFCVSVTDTGLKYLARMRNLKELDLRSCDNISDIGMAYLTEGGCTVTSLDVSFCDKIGDQALNHLSQGLFHMRSLSLNHCQISDDGLIRIAKNLVDLETLNIGQCSKVTDKGLQTLAEYLHNLHSIDLYGCTQLSPEGLNAIAKLPKLAKVNFSL